MLSPRVIIAIVGAVLGVVVFYLTRGSYADNRWPLAYALGSFIGVYVFGNILMGVVQGMREASADQGPPKPRAPRGPTEPPR